MQSADVLRWLCVSIHDVAPATWPQCEQLLATVAAVGDIPLTLLVVPAYHGAAETVPSWDRFLERRLAHGDELALHGYTHLDQGPPPRGWRERCARYGYTKGEGEFAALSEEAAAHRLELGMQWFARRGWPLQGFIAPAWLLSAGGWRALRRSGLLYTTTWRRFHFLQDGLSLHAPSLVYSSRNAWGRALSRRAVSAAGMLWRDAPLARLALHPRDALDPATLRHVQNLLDGLLATRLAQTKSGFAHSWRARMLPSGAAEAAA